MMSAPPKPAEMLTKIEVSQRLQVSIKTIERWMASGDLPVHRFGKSVRILTADFRAFVGKARKWNLTHIGSPVNHRRLQKPKITPKTNPKCQ